MRRVVLETRLAGEVERNLRYARLAMLDCLRRGEAPFASHLLYPQCLDDLKPEERKLGMEAGFAWGDVAEATVVYDDFGVSNGMGEGIDRALAAKRPVEFRQLPTELMALL